MINGNITEFLDRLYYGDELFFEYHKTDYLLQGWNENGEAIMVLDKISQTAFKEYIWKCKKALMTECAEEFLKSNIWNGKNFMQIQRDIIWKE